MPKNVVATLTFADQVPPVGTTPSGYQVRLLDGSEKDVLPPQASTASAFTFTAPAPGTYTVSAAAVDQNGTPWSTPITAEVVVPADTSPVPATITVALA